MQEQTKVFHFPKPVSFRVQKEKDFQDIVITSIEFGDIDVGTVKPYVRKVQDYILHAKNKIQQNHIETMARALGKNFAELQQSYKNNIKAAVVVDMMIIITPISLPKK